MFAADRNDMLPPAAYGVDNLQQYTWDGWIDSYIGGHAPDWALAMSVRPQEYCPGILKCPADTIEVTPGWGSFASRRTYSMNAAGPDWGTQWQVDSQNHKYPLPTIAHGVGIYWQDSGPLDPDARGYKSTVVRDYSGTILLVEQPSQQNFCGQVWPAFSLGPQASGASDIYQTDLPGSTSTRNFGNNAYGLHSKRFNYGHLRKLGDEKLKNN